MTIVRKISGDGDDAKRYEKGIKDNLKRLVDQAPERPRKTKRAGARPGRSACSSQQARRTRL